MQTSRAPAISVSAESCIPAGLRLGPVPGTFKLGKYLSDRKEPGPKKKVFSYGLSCTAGPWLFVDSGEAGFGRGDCSFPVSLRSSLLRASQESKGKHFQNVLRCLPLVLAGKPGRPCPLPLLPSAGAPSPSGLRRTRGLSRRSGRAPALDTDVLEASPEPRARCRRALVPPPSPRPPGAPLIGALPLLLVEPGRPKAGSSFLEPWRGEGTRQNSPRILGFVPGRSRAEADSPIYFWVWLGFVLPIPLPGPESFGLDMKAVWGERAGATPETASGCRSQVLGQPSAARPPPKASGGSPLRNCKQPAQPEREG